MHFSFRRFRKKHNTNAEEHKKLILKRLARKSIVLVGLMGAGKTAIGKRLATKIELPFVDADTEIEKAAGMTIKEIFEEHGEAYFRDGEQRVIARILQEEGPQILATGGGAYMNTETRKTIQKMGVSIWLKADFDVLMERVSRKSHRPLLQNEDPAAVMKSLITERYPVYQQADITVQSRDVAHEVIVDEIMVSLDKYLK